MVDLSIHNFVYIYLCYICSIIQLPKILNQTNNGANKITSIKKNLLNFISHQNKVKSTLYDFHYFIKLNQSLKSKNHPFYLPSRKIKIKKKNNKNSHHNHNLFCHLLLFYSRYIHF